MTRLAPFSACCGIVEAAKLERAYDARRHARHNGAGWDVFGDNAARRDNRVVADTHALEDHAAIPEPDAVFEDDRRSRGIPGLVFDAVEIRVHDQHVRSEQA